MIDDYQPRLVCIVEIYMQKEEEIQIPGYSLLYCNDRSANSEKKHKEKNRVDVIYTQQENLKPNNE